MPNAGLSRECEELSQHKLLAAKGFFSALPRFLLFPGNRGAQIFLSLTNAPAFDYDNKANLINSAVNEIASWIHTAEQHDRLLHQHAVHSQSAVDPVILSQLLPYLNDWNVSGYDPYVSDLIWSMDDSACQLFAVSLSLFCFSLSLYLFSLSGFCLLLCFFCFSCLTCPPSLSLFFSLSPIRSNA